VRRLPRPPEGNNLPTHTRKQPGQGRLTDPKSLLQFFRAFDARSQQGEKLFDRSRHDAPE
jgi:hypothetical protein